MYQEHFGLSQEPFSIAPDPRFLFLSESHNEALAHLMYGFSHGGFVLITGEVGTGKTTLLRNLLDRTPPELDVAFILNPRLTVRELLETLCDELGVTYSTSDSLSVKQYIDALNKHLLATHQAGRSTVVIIDEAQNLSPAVLEQIRLLTNLETNEKKLIRMILLGQPELGVMLAQNELRQLAQRITARYHLKPLSRDDVQAYVVHRLARAGGHPNIFSPSAIRALYSQSKGTPRLINVIADRAMLGAYVEGRYQVNATFIKRAAKEVFGDSAVPAKHWYAIAAGVALIGALGAAYLWLDNRPEQEAAPGTQAAAPGSDPGPPQLQAPARESEATPQIEYPGPTQPAAASQVQRAYDPAGIDIRRPTGGMSAIQRQAYAAVFAAWGADYRSDDPQIPCDFAPRAGLQCLSRKGGWSEIAQLNSPVVLELWDDSPAPYYAALIGAQEAYYELELDGRVQLVSPRDLRDSWLGAYVILWQTPPDYSGSLREGDRHPTVNWLRDKLYQLYPGSAGPAQGDVFGSALADLVIRFQSDEGLIADGVVGPATWIRLSDRLDLPAPKLR
ncbi:MAG: AAA family ATPase [Pseudomonadota bacterium]